MIRLIAWWKSLTKALQPNVVNEDEYEDEEDEPRCESCAHTTFPSTGGETKEGEMRVSTRVAEAQQHGIIEGVVYAALAAHAPLPIRNYTVLVIDGDDPGVSELYISSATWKLRYKCVVLSDTYTNILDLAGTLYLAVTDIAKKLQRMKHKNAVGEYKGPWVDITTRINARSQAWREIERERMGHEESVGCE